MAGPNLTVYTLPACGQCFATKRFLEGKNMPFTLVDLSTAPAEEASHIRALGYTQAPVVIFTDASNMQHHWYGFRPDLLTEAVAALKSS